MNDSPSKADKENLIIDTYCEIVKLKSRLPTYSDFLDHHITEATIRHNFGNLTRLHTLIEETFPEVLSENLAHESQIFGGKRLEMLQEDLLKYRRFVITTAVTEKKVFKPFYESLKRYCEHNDALLLILGCSDVASRSAGRSWTFDPILRNEHFVSKEIKLNSRFFISNIKTSAKQIKPTTGLARIGQRNGSYVFASPKQSLEIGSTSASRDRSPMAIMTTGAVTVPDYSTDRYMSERTSYIAENDHVMGAIIVEVETDKQFHFRQVQANNRGEFTDFGNRYSPDGTVQPVSSTLVLGDWHSGKTSKEVIDTLPGIVEDGNVVDIVVHDLFDGKSVNHHIENQPLKLARRALLGQNGLEKEFEKVGVDVEYLLGLIPGNLVVVKSNHDEWLERYLDAGSYVNDPENHYISLDLARKYLEGEMVLKYAIEEYSGISEPDRIVWLDRGDEHTISGVELGQHGDAGPSGKPATLQTIEADVGQAVVGHIHSPAILRGVWRVGTSTDLQVDYNKKGSSNWTNTHCFVYDDGSRQLVSVINGKYRLS